ncbi:transcriptional regulator, XRE family [Hymenobacter roseosalivarius DSM 11622]|uniref:Transcriptional regulator, XRE family n=1 Tax=Hymenobacter roseosalivarius DSM 11622 TaxID=645990 RepID=A0A1W1VFL0_9BACT|nr:helix-turn-helix transcriptional regulator [Hymenobacter roseosalivarius]SMB92010.1 transcriptional regulator, XRE family [Hymenobacter roseosalivarius DSM 11622]
MTKKPLKSASVPAPLTPEQRIALRADLGAFMRERREAQQPPLTQMALSEQLGFSYSVVSTWENNSRAILEGQLKAWAEKLGVDPDLQKEPLARFAPVVQNDETSKPNSGSRVEREVNARLVALRKQRNLTIREMGALLGMSAAHYYRVETNKGNLTIAQLRQVVKRLDVSYEYLIDGKGSGETYQDLKKENERLKRENQLLESFRRQVELNQVHS